MSPVRLRLPRRREFVACLKPPLSHLRDAADWIIMTTMTIVIVIIIIVIVIVIIIVIVIVIIHRHIRTVVVIAQVKVPKLIAQVNSL